jgi:hypothetical protein
MKTAEEIRDIARARGVELKRGTLLWRLRRGYRDEELLQPPTPNDYARRRWRKDSPQALVRVKVPGWGVRC